MLLPQGIVGQPYILSFPKGWSSVPHAKKRSPEGVTMDKGCHYCNHLAHTCHAFTASHHELHFPGLSLAYKHDHPRLTFSAPAHSCTCFELCSLYLMTHSFTVSVILCLHQFLSQFVPCPCYRDLLLQKKISKPLGKSDLRIQLCCGITLNKYYFISGTGIFSDYTF